LFGSIERPSVQRDAYLHTHWISTWIAIWKTMVSWYPSEVCFGYQFHSNLLDFVPETSQMCRIHDKANACVEDCFTYHRCGNW